VNLVFTYENFDERDPPNSTCSTYEHERLRVKDGFHEYPSAETQLYGSEARFDHDQVGCGFASKFVFKVRNSTHERGHGLSRRPVRERKGRGHRLPQLSAARNPQQDSTTNANAEVAKEIERGGCVIV
jgi:hypothetical protein